MGAGLTSTADRVSERLSPRLIISGGARRRLTRPSNTSPTRSAIEQAFKLYICAVNRRRMHFTRDRPEPIYTWRWRSRSYYRAPARKKNKGSGGAASGAASEIYGGAAPPGAGVSPNRRGSRLPGSAMRARVGLHGEYWLPTGRTINRRSVDVARWEFTRSVRTRPTRAEYVRLSGVHFANCLKPHRLGCRS